MLNKTKLIFTRKDVADKDLHPFHLVNPSLLPVVTGFSAMCLVVGLVFYWHPSDDSFVTSNDGYFIRSAFFIFLTTLFAWFIQVVIESGMEHHTPRVKKGFRYGMALFIVSEIMFFFAFFWGVFHFSLSPSVAIGCVWPPQGIQPMEIWGLPLVNTILLLLSGVTITRAHHFILESKNLTSHKKFTQELFVTIVLGITFLICQGIEYKYGITFKWKENVYGSTFFVTTGFHGFHVTVGTIFLLFCLLWNNLTWIDPTFSLRLEKILNNLKGHNQVISEDYKLDLNKFKYDKENHFGFEAAAWYWHFVDVVWLFLFITIYWWGSTT